MNNRRVVIAELFDGIEVVATLRGDQPDPTAEQLEALATVYAANGGCCTCRVVERLWFGPPILTPSQQAALATGSDYDDSSRRTVIGSRGRRSLMHW